MHLSNKQRIMNKTFTVLTNRYCSSDNDFDQEQSTNRILESSNQLAPILSKDRFCTFTKYKIKQSPTIASVDQNQPRYFDSPTMITIDDDDDDSVIPVSRCSNKTAATTAAAAAAAELSLNETDLSDLLIFTNPNRIMNESMQVVISRHPSLHDLKYINDVSSVLVVPSILFQDKEEPIYQELIQVEHSISTLPIDYTNDIDENKENRPPLMPIECQVSGIPVWTPSPTNRNLKPPDTTCKSKKQEEVKKKIIKPSLTDLLDEWSSMTPKLKELLSNTRKMPLRMPQLTTHGNEFRRLKQLLNEMELTTSSWTHAINQCRYVLRHAQQQSHRP